MAINLRTVKGIALTHAELDANFTDITSSMVHSGSISGTTLTLHRSGSQYDIDLSGLGGGASTPTGSFLTSGSFDENLSEITLYSEDGDYTLDLSSLGGISLGALSVTEGAASESGSLSYNSGTGVFTFNPADLSGLGGGGSSFDVSAAADGEILFRTSATSADGKHVKQYYDNGSYGKGLTIGYTHSKNAGLNIYETSNDPQGYSEDHIILSDSSGSDLIIRNGGKEAGDGYIFLKVDELGASGTAFNVAKLGGPDKSVYLYHSGSNVFRTEYIGSEASVIISGSISGSNDVFFSGLPNTSKPHIVGYDTATGQLTYYSTGSFGSGGGSTDYVSGVTLNGTTLEFTGVGSAFGSGVDLSTLAGGSTDITALNNFTSSIQSEVDSLQSVTGSYLTSGSYNNGNSTITLYSGDTNYSIDLSGLSGGGAVNGTASLSYDNIPVNETVNDVWYFAANNRGVATDTPTGFTPSTTQVTIAASSSNDVYYYDNFNSAVVGDGLIVSDNTNLVRYTIDGIAVNENLFSSYSTSSLSDLAYPSNTEVPWYPIYMEDIDNIYILSASNDTTPSTIGAYTASNPQSPSEKVNNGFSYTNWYGRALSISSSFFVTNKADGTSTLVLRSNTQSQVDTAIGFGNGNMPVAFDGKGKLLAAKVHAGQLSITDVDLSIPGSPTIHTVGQFQSSFSGSFGNEPFLFIDGAYDSNLDKFFIASTDYLDATELAIAQMTGSSVTGDAGIYVPAEDYWISSIAIGDPFIGRSSTAIDLNARTIGLNASTSTIYVYNKGDYRPSDQRDASIIAFDYSGAGTFNEVITMPSASYGHVPLSVLSTSYIQRGYGGLLYSEANNTIVVGTYDNNAGTPKVRVYDAASPYSLLQVIEGVWMNTACNITNEGNIVFIDGITLQGIVLTPNAGDSKTFTYTVSKYDYDPNTTIDLNEDNNVYVKLQTKEIASTTVNTGSFYISSSVSNNTITFTQGDGTTETLTVDTGSSGIALTDLSVALGAAAESGSLSYNSGTGVFTFNPADLSGLGGGSTDTGSFYISSSVSNNTITFTQGDGTTESLTVDTGSAGISLEDLSVSLGAAAESGSLSYNNGTGVFTFNPADLSGLGGGSTDTGSLMVTGSVTNNTITFTKGDGTTFSLTVDTGSASGGAASNTFATMSVGGTNLIADSTTDTLTIETGNLISASANPATDTYTFNVLPSPQFLTKKEGETGVSAGQGVFNTTPIILTWTDQGPDHTANSNTYWDINNANDTTYEYDRSLYQYVKIKEEGMYEIEYQLHIQGTNSSGSYGIVSLHRVNNTLTTVDLIQSRQIVGGFQGLYSDEVEYSKVYYYVPQTAIDQDEAYILMKLQGGASISGTLTVGGFSSTNQNSTFWRFRKIEDVGTAR